jgi:three-Cys-motif partner protein
MPRTVGEWTKDKLKILSDYLPSYLLATSSALERIYVDAFAGPGTNVLKKTRVEIDGSPLIALKARASNGSRFSRLFFIEQNKKSAAELRGHLRQLDPEGRATVIEGEVDQRLPEVIHGLHRRAPTFVFLDTQGIDPQWKTLESITPWRVEFLINFPLGMSINRNPDSAKTEAYFGTKEFYPFLRYRGSGKARALLDLYKKRLADLGFGYTTANDRLVRTLDGKRLYYLVFASKIDVGQRIMESVISHPDARGQAGFNFDR